jgi:CheY-like chemotaxis protein
VGRFVLVVDDDADCREVLRVLLEAEGHECVSASDGAEALEALQIATPSVVVLDVMMPNVHGLDVIRSMRADPRLADVPVVLVSAAPTGSYASVETDPYVRVAPKPLDVDRFLGVMRDLLPPQADSRATAIPD